MNKEMKGVSLEELYTQSSVGQTVRKIVQYNTIADITDTITTFPD